MEHYVQKVLDDIIAETDRSSRTEYRMYFSGEYDSSQTKFETMSNHLEIGVIAPTKEIAQNLLLVLRIMIDNNPYMIIASAERYIEDKWWAEAEEGPEEGPEEEPEEGPEEEPEEALRNASVSELRKMLIEHDDYLSHFRLTEQPKNTLCGYDLETHQVVDEIISPPIDEIMLLTVHDVNTLYATYCKTGKPQIPVTGYSLYEFMRSYAWKQRKYPILKIFAV
jgi:hypothetical protein